MKYLWSSVLLVKKEKAAKKSCQQTVDLTALQKSRYD